MFNGYPVGMSMTGVTLLRDPKYTSGRQGCRDLPRKEPDQCEGSGKRGEDNDDGPDERSYDTGEAERIVIRLTDSGRQHIASR